MAMIVLSRVLNYRVNRWANIIVGILMAIYQILTMNVGTPPTLHYIFFSVIEVASCLIIVWNAWKWINPEGISNSKIKV